eukprot:3836506-Amphidinium_carterae.1
MLKCSLRASVSVRNCVPDESWEELVAVRMAMHVVESDLVTMELLEPTLGPEPWMPGLKGSLDTSRIVTRSRCCKSWRIMHSNFLQTFQ